MLGRVDDFLIDRVFQPMADRMAERCSPLRLGATCLEQSFLIAMVLIGLDALGGRLSWGWAGVWGMLYLVGGGFLVRFIGRTDRYLRLGRVNPLRLVHRGPRLFVLVLAPFDLLRLVALSSEPWASKAMALACLVLMVGGMFFSACQKLPPAERKAAPGLVGREAMGEA